MKYLIWGLLLPINWLVTIVFWTLNPIAAAFVTYQNITAQVKRLDFKIITLRRARLVWWLSWFDTFDNPVDEYWYGSFGKTNKDTQADYDASKLLRYIYRLKWIYRNTGYGFWNRFGIAKDNPIAFNIKKQVTLAFGYSDDINIGWKEHRGFDKLMYAGGFLRLKKQIIKID